MIGHNNEPSMWSWNNAAPITKTVIEGAFAIASLSTAIAAIAMYTGASLPAFLGFAAIFANPVGIAILSFAFLYFAVQAFSSYKQMEANLEMENAAETVKKEVKAEAAKVKFDDKAEAAVNQAVATAKIDEKAQEAVTQAVATAKIDEKAQTAVAAEVAKVKFDDKAQAAVETKAGEVKFEEKATKAVEAVVKSQNLVTEDKLNNAIKGLATKTELGEKANNDALTTLTGRVETNETALKEKADKTELAKKLNIADLGAEMKTFLEIKDNPVIQHLSSIYAPIASTKS